MSPRRGYNIYGMGNILVQLALYFLYLIFSLIEKNFKNVNKITE